MAGIPERYEETFRTLERLTAQLHAMMETGEFYTLSLVARRKLLRNVKRLYNRLVGGLGPRVVVGAVAAGVLLLAGCFQPTVPDLEPDPDPEPEPDPPAQIFVPAFSTVAAPNPYGIGVPVGDLFLQTQPIFADLDGDGDPDLISGSRLYDPAYYYLNHSVQYHQDGITQFDPETTLALPRSDSGGYGYFQTDLKAFVDIDDDGDLDAILSGDYYGESGLLLALNSGTALAPTFAPPARGPLDAMAGEYADDIAFADIDADGDPDMLFVHDPSGELRFSLNNGTPTVPDFLAAVSSPYTDLTLTDVSFHSVEASDIDNDGDVDILVGAYFDDTVTKEPRVLFYENTGTAAVPAFAPVVTNPFGLTFPGTYDWGIAVSYQGGVGVAAADVDDDGDHDLLVGPYSLENGSSSESTFLFFENTGAMEDVVE